MTRQLQLDLESIEAGLKRWFERKIPHAHTLSLSPLKTPDMGASNETFSFDLRWQEAGERKLEKLVVRWAPMRFQLYPKYDMKEQFLLMKRLENTGVPAPKARWLVEDESVIGRPFFIMDRIEGWIPGDNPSYHLAGPIYEGTREYREKIWWEGVETLARINTLDWEKTGLEFLGAPKSGTDPIDQHIAYYEKMLRMTEEAPPPFLEETLVWLKKNRFAPKHVSLCWGDARLGNLIFHNDRVVGVLDWEQSLLGDPDSDLAWFLLMDWMLCEGHLMRKSERLKGLPGIEETIAHYQRKTNREVENFFYQDVFATWRIAVIMHRAAEDFKTTGYHLSDTDVYGPLRKRLSGLLGL